MEVKDLPPILTTEQVAELLRIGLSTLHNWVKRGYLPKPFKIGRKSYFDSAQILKILKKIRKKQGLSITFRGSNR